MFIDGWMDVRKIVSQYNVSVCIQAYSSNVHACIGPAPCADTVPLLMQAATLLHHNIDGALYLCDATKEGKLIQRL